MMIKWVISNSTRAGEKIEGTGIVMSITRMTKMNIIDVNIGQNILPGTDRLSSCVPDESIDDIKLGQEIKYTITYHA